MTRRRHSAIHTMTSWMPWSASGGLGKTIWKQFISQFLVTVHLYHNFSLLIPTYISAGIGFPSLIFLRASFDPWYDACNRSTAEEYLHLFHMKTSLKYLHLRDCSKNSTITLNVLLNTSWVAKLCACAKSPLTIQWAVNGSGVESGTSHSTTAQNSFTATACVGFASSCTTNQQTHVFIQSVASHNTPGQQNKLGIQWDTAADFQAIWYLDVTIAWSTAIYR